jgi:hypothetical protein
MMLWQKRHPIYFFLNASITASIVEGVQTHLKASGYQFRTMHSPLTLSKYRGMKLYANKSDGGNTTISHCELLLVCRSCIAHRRMIADFFERDGKGHPKITYVKSVPCVAATVVLLSCTGPGQVKHM